MEKGPNRSISHGYANVINIKISFVMPKVSHDGTQKMMM